ncbi:hypothetical protein C8J57DRAFT_1311550 [Mycena rebaudengoi]|nr:hypothetical protein C8J57DRAFT_1311550 [Mycena rebaudengoi]
MIRWSWLPKRLVDRQFLMLVSLSQSYTWTAAPRRFISFLLSPPGPDLLIMPPLRRGFLIESEIYWCAFAPSASTVA